MEQITITASVEQIATLQFAPLTAAGKPATLDGSIQCEAQSGTGVFAITSGLAIDFVTPDVLADPTVPENTVYRVWGDADPTSGQQILELEVTLIAIPANAVNLNPSPVTLRPKVA